MAVRGRIPRASNIVVDGIREWILTERLSEGSQLPSETELMETFGLGRATVREGLRLLEADGLIYVKRGQTGGIYVRHADIGQVSEALALLFSFRETTLREFLDFRLLVEPEITRLAAVNATAEQREEILRVGEGKIRMQNRSAEFHSVVARACGNDVFGLVMQGLHMPLARHIRPDRVSELNLTDTEKAHAKVARLVADGEADRAKRAMIRHLEAYRDFLENTGLVDEPIVPRHARPSVT